MQLLPVIDGTYEQDQPLGGELKLVVAETILLLRHHSQQSQVCVICLETFIV